MQRRKKPISRLGLIFFVLIQSIIKPNSHKPKMNIPTVANKETNGKKMINKTFQEM
jgi:hypothetical protein